MYSLNDALKNHPTRIGHGICIGNYLRNREKLKNINDISELEKMEELKNYREIREIIKSKNLNEIRNVLTLLDNVLNIIRESGVVLELCPNSNLQTKAAIEPYPIEALYKMGIGTTINPDNNTVSGTSISEECEYIIENTSLEQKDLIRIYLNAIGAAFLSNEKKALYKGIINKFSNEFDKNNKCK